MSRFVVSFLVNSIVSFIRSSNNTNYKFSLFLQVINSFFFSCCALYCIYRHLPSDHMLMTWAWPAGVCCLQLIINAVVVLLKWKLVRKLCGLIQVQVIKINCGDYISFVMLYMKCYHVYSPYFVHIRLQLSVKKKFGRAYVIFAMFR